MFQKKVGKKRNLVLFLFVIGIIIVGSVAAYYFISSRGGNGTSVDLSFDQWVVKAPRGTTGIFDKGTYIEVASYDFNIGTNAQLSFDPIKEGSFTFKIKSPDLTKIRKSVVNINSGANAIIEIERKGFLYVEVLDVTGIKTFEIMKSLDTKWHTIKISFKIDGANSMVSVWFDGNVILDDFVFSTNVAHVDGITFGGSRYRQVPNLTYLIFGSLIRYK